MKANRNPGPAGGSATLFLPPLLCRQQLGEGWEQGPTWGGAGTAIPGFLDSWHQFTALIAFPGFLEELPFPSVHHSAGQRVIKVTWVMTLPWLLDLWRGPPSGWLSSAPEPASLFHRPGGSRACVILFHAHLPVGVTWELFKMWRPDPPPAQCRDLWPRSGCCGV